MKRLLLIILLLFFCVGMVANAELRFGDWSKWDEGLPPWGTKYWIWALKEQIPLEVKFKDKTLLLASHLFFCTDEKCSQRISILVYSAGNEEIKKQQIPNPKFALVALSPQVQDKKIKIIAYRMIDNESKFFETWEIDFKNNRNVVPGDTKFREIFKEWVVLLKDQIKISGEITDKTLDNFLPKLQVLDKETFIIGIGVKLSKK